MKFRFLLTLCLVGGAMTAFAQTHKEGIEYYKAEQYNNAQELLERNFNNQGTDKALANYYLGRIAYDSKDYTKATKYFNQGIAADAECPFNYVGLGAVQLKQGNKKEAEAQFKLAEKFGKKNAEVMVDIAKAYYEADPVLYDKQMLKYDDKARRIDMNDPAIYLFEGDMQKDRKNVGDAAGMYEMAANYDNQSAAAYVKYAKLFKDVNPGFGIRKLEELVNVNPNSALGQRELAKAYYEQGMYDKAAKEYGKYVKNPNHFKVDENEYSFLLFYNGEYQNGYDYATKLLAENPGDFSAKRYQLMNAANIKDFKGNLLEMAENLYNDHKADPQKNKLAQIDYNLIIMMMNNAERYDESEAVAREAVREFPNANNFKSSLATTLVLQDRYVDAADVMNKALAEIKDPGYTLLQQGARYNFTAGIFSQKENPELAPKYLDNAKKIAADALAAEKSVRAYKLNADVNKPLNQGDVNDAVPYYEQAVALFESAPKDADKNLARDSYLYLAEYYMADKAKALDLANKALALDPQNEKVVKFVNALK